jgi:hypothetical protein
MGGTPPQHTYKRKHKATPDILSTINFFEKEIIWKAGKLEQERYRKEFAGG